MNHDTRITLLHRLRDRDDRRSWEDFVDLYSRYLYTVARNLGLNHHDAEDALQQVFLKVSDKLSTFEYSPASGRFRAWLCTVCRNTVRDQQRRRASRQRQQEVLQAEETLPPDELDQQAEKEWRDFLANEALRIIREKESPLALSCFELHAAGKDVASIAEQLGIAANTVYVYKARVIEQLSREIRRLRTEFE
ncbi:MAG: hypothetical protein RL095_3127 [Verrucomicrobiota bacterium]|jgi:RNA polymerase sigma-70 factor (ECF subfamily)